MIDVPRPIFRGYQPITYGKNCMCGKKPQLLSCEGSHHWIGIHRQGLRFTSYTISPSVSVSPPPGLILYVWQTTEEDNASLVSLNVISPLPPRRPSFPLNRSAVGHTLSHQSLLIWFLPPLSPPPLPPLQSLNPPRPRLKCLNTSPLHVLVVQVRWVHG